jgi:hypothetical protein
MRLSVKIIVGAAIVAASVAAATFGASAPAAASEIATGTEATDLSARKKKRSTSLRVAKLSRRAGEPPNANRTYYRPVPHFYPFAQQRGYF